MPTAADASRSAAAEFIYEQPATGGIEYVFKHALTQEVAYNSLLIERRKQLHERAGQAIESIFADQLDDHLTQLAHHYSLSDNADKAVEYLGRAGQQALQRSAHTDAINSLTAAMDLLQKLPQDTERVQRELRLQFALGQALMSVKVWQLQKSSERSCALTSFLSCLGEPRQSVRLSCSACGLCILFEANFASAFRYMLEELMLQGPVALAIPRALLSRPRHSRKQFLQHG